MPLSDSRTPEIVTIPFVSATNSASYIFNFDLPTIPLNKGASQAQILWVSITYSADGTVGTRVPVFDVLDDSATSVFAVASINTQTAGQLIEHTILQGVWIFPNSVFGLMRTIPVNGLFVFNNWEMRFADLAAISAGDSFAGNVQVRLY